MKTIELSDVAALGPFVQPGSAAPVLVTENGQMRAAVVPIAGEDAEDLLLSLSPKFAEILERSERRLAAEGGVSSDEVRQQLGLK